MDIGKKIKIARQKIGLTQKKLGEYCGLATGTIQQYELGKRQPRLEQLQKIANALNVPIYELVENNDPIPDIGLQANIIAEEKKSKLLLEFIRNMGYVVKFSGCPSRANLWMYDEEEKGFWTGEKFITNCQLGKKCETCHRREITFYELSKNKKSVKVKISTMHSFLTMVENDVDKILSAIFDHGDI